MKTHKLQKFQSLLKEAEHLASEIQEESITDIFYNGGHVELIVACILGHRWSNKTQGPDAYTSDGVPVEYKTINKRSGGSSFQFHWKQLSKLHEAKEYYFIIRDGVHIESVHMMTVDQVKALGEEYIRNRKKPRQFDTGGFNIYIKDLVDAKKII